ncbi:class I SAM-dependent methyltransferase [Spirochaeta isovalerica]|uniref:SAM-dependent methyltransferase n=1 Tax=Spirochaeta isovalerica TaxID=150 RepID=A0A841REW2_9SPIO|nr:class I SAM-dependent methyltransferase [Spirochaeta isovalerica]MBB6481747.1 SAM-dependent methyltransferase [Spirochaeta isovalerica]
MNYLMESRDEIERLEKKTGFDAVKQQALWAGLREGMRVADIGCGSGRTSSFLKELTGPSGSVTGVDLSQDRLDYARATYGRDGLTFEQRNIYEPLDDLGQFDFIWVRFLLEYHKKSQFELVQKFASMLSPGGILCLIDLDHNSLNHFGIPERLEKALEESVAALSAVSDFDPYAGRKLYSHMHRLGLEEIDVHVGTHHLMFGEMNETDSYNWTKKLTIGLSSSPYDFPEYEGGFEEFAAECLRYIADPGRFTYTPLISCRGIKGV